MSLCDCKVVKFGRLAEKLAQQLVLLAILIIIIGNLERLDEVVG